MPGPLIALRIPAMDCPVERGMVERALEGHPLVKSLAFDMEPRLALVTLADPGASPEPLLAAVRAAGLTCELAALSPAKAAVIAVEGLAEEHRARILAIAGDAAAVDVAAGTVAFEGDDARRLAVLEGLLAAGFKASPARRPEPGSLAEQTGFPARRLLPALALALAAEACELAGAPEAAGLALALGAIALSGLATLRQGALNLARGLFNMDSLMAVAVAGAVILGEWPEAAMVMTLYEIGEGIEAMCLQKARNAIRGLLKVVPDTLEARLAGAWVRLPVEGLPAGVVYRIEPGERAAMDGVVLEGAGGMDESMVTGESLPVDKAPGDAVWAGALALDAALVIRATAEASDSMTARIIRAVERAEQTKAPLQRFVDRFARVYTPSVFALALACALLGPLVAGGGWAAWIYKALVLLVIACPCALVISTPVTIVSAVALAASNGVLVKGGVFMEEARNLRHVALDKTGTVTRGAPAFASLALMPGTDEASAWRLAGSLAALNSHPVSAAVAAAARERGFEPAPVTGFRALPGAGVEGRIGKSLVRLTSARWLEQAGLLTGEARAAFEAAHAQGRTAVAVSDFFGVAAVFAVADEIKPGAARAIGLLKRAGLKPVLLTGDNALAARAVAESAGIEECLAELLPEQKLAEIERLEALGPTAMAGDGINDAPALARARIGFAMGVRGTDIALEAADVALMDDDVGRIAWLKRLSELAHGTVVANIAFALGVKACFAAAALAGLANMWMAVFADTGVCLLVVAWGLRLLKAGRKVDRMAGFA
ncbi:MAG: heavy metal translocating P-type ATPase [Duodenibacillus sp.]|nr:heavy metal translocating P-type ATPase [Duodenibacillus sp.]